MAEPVMYVQNFDVDTGRMGDQDKDNCIPRFHMTESMKDGELCQIEMVEIITPGDRLSRPIMKVKEDHRNRWPRQYQAFRSGIDLNIEGHPIATWQALSYYTQNELRALGFQTIEQLAVASDGQISGVNNGFVWRKKAQVFCNQNVALSGKDQEISELKARLEKLEARNVLPESGQGHAQGKRGWPKGKPRPRKAGSEGGPEEPGVGDIPSVQS